MKISKKALACCGVAALAVSAPIAPLAEGASKRVTVKNFKFTPSRVTISRGDSVTWRFLKDPAPHNVKGSGGIKSKSKITTGTYRKKFTRKGTFKYICTIHPNMKGTVVVR